MPSQESQDRDFMRQAIQQAQIAFAKDEIPIGAVIVHQGRVIAKAHNQVETLKDPTAHAEMIAITQATHFLTNKWLQESQLYVTIEPCSMCAGALVLARVSRIIFGSRDPKAGACGSVINIVQHGSLNHRIALSGPLMEDECGRLMQDFFAAKRKPPSIKSD